MDRAFPTQARELCTRLDAPKRLVVHLELVHEAAVELIEALASQMPDLSFCVEDVLLGAALHDLGKVLHPHELYQPGREHERDGPALLESCGIKPHIARFARTHATCRNGEICALEDKLIALADTLWRGRRVETLENAVMVEIAERLERPQWEIFGELDAILTEVSSRGDTRLSRSRVD